MTKVKSKSPSSDDAHVSNASESRRTLYKVPVHSGEPSTSGAAASSLQHQYIEIIRQDDDASPVKRTQASPKEAESISAPIFEASTSLDMEVDEITEDQVS